MKSRHEIGKNAGPDRGPKMSEGMHHFDKGYTSDNEHFDPYSHGSEQRGNRYMKMQNEIVHSDDKKLAREKFSKIA